MTKFDSVQQDYFVRGYKVELVHSSGRIVSSKTYQADFWKKESDRTAYYSKSFGQLDYDTEYTINIYPMTPFGAFSSPLSHTFTTEEEVVDSNSVRYEFEDYNTKYSRMNYDSIYASDGALVLSAQGGFSDKEAYLTTTEEESPYSLTFTVDLPYDVEYNIEYAVGYIYGSNNVSRVEILVDETSIGTNDNSFDRDLSAVPGDTSAVFPWKYIPLKHYNGKSLKLSKGEHTVTAKIYRPTNQAQPYLFCLDYIQFTPKTAILDMSSTAKIEAENYVDGITITETSGATYSPKQGDSTICSNQKYAAFDSNPVDSSYYDFVIPIFAKEPGLYNFEYVINSNTGLPSIYLGDADTGIKINSTYTETTLGEFVDDKNTYFNSSWATASKYYVENVAIPYGSNNITIRIPARTGENDIVLYTDYLQFSPSPDTSYVTIDEAGKRIEFEDCLEDADLGEKVLGEGFASKDYYVFNSWRSYAKTHSINTFVEFTESGNYNIEHLIGMQSSTDVSLVELYLNDTVIATNDDASYTRNLYDESAVGWKYAPLCLY